MKKVIFEGTVNGTKYDNVNDYNAAVKEALKNGSVEAHSSTHAVEDEGASEKPTEVQSLPNDMFPGFYHCKGIDDLDDKFIDAGLEQGVDSLNTELGEYLDKHIKNSLCKFTKAETELYKRMVDQILEYLGGTTQSFEMEGNNIEAELRDILDDLKELQTRAEKIAAKKSVVDLTASTYSRIQEMIMQRLDEYNNAGVDMRPRQGENLAGQAAPTADDYTKNIHKLVQAIFGE